MVKSNGPANRDIRHFIRNQDTGLLEDRSQDIRNLALSPTLRLRQDNLYHLIDMCERNGEALTKDGKYDGVCARLETMQPIEPFVIDLQKEDNLSTTIKNTVTALEQAGRVTSYKFTELGPTSWLGTVTGPMANGTYKARTARDNLLKNAELVLTCTTLYSKLWEERSTLCLKYSEKKKKNRH